jgi:hypothetical protein
MEIQPNQRQGEEIPYRSKAEISSLDRQKTRRKKHMENRVSSRVQRVTGHEFEGFWATGLRGLVGLCRKSPRAAGNRVGLHHQKTGHTGPSGLPLLQSLSRLGVRV